MISILSREDGSMQRGHDQLVGINKTFAERRRKIRKMEVLSVEGRIAGRSNYK